jgi:hypothetical protein
MSQRDGSEESGGPADSPRRLLVSTIDELKMAGRVTKVIAFDHDQRDSGLKNCVCALLVRQ